jgi:hypothetical protein
MGNETLVSNHYLGSGLDQAGNAAEQSLPLFMGGD